MAYNEYHILLTACHINPAADHLAKLQNMLTRPVDGDRLIELAVREGLAGLLYKNLIKAGLVKHWGPAQEQKLRSLYYLNVRNNLKLLHDLKEILQRLNRNKPRVVLMQGMALLQQIYQDVGLRPLTDIDLWVLPEDRHKLAVALTGLGYQIDPTYPNTFRKGSTIVDVNTHILWADRIKTRRLLLDRSQKDIYDHCQIIDCEGARCRCLNRHDQVLYLSLHALKHYGERLIWLADIRGLIAGWNPCDWEKLGKRADAMGQQKAVACILFLLANLFDYQPPLEAQIPLGKTRLNRLERMILKKRSNGHPLPQWSPLLLLSGGKGLHKRLALGFETLFPRPEILRQVFADASQLSVRQIYWKRVRQIVGAMRLQSDN
jgi:hypothetical protein